MNILLSPDLETLIHARVASGQYTSPAEVIREALQLLEERDRLRQMRLDDLRKEIAVGIEQIERGEYTVLDENTFERIRSEGRKRLEAEREQKPS